MTDLSGGGAGGTLMSFAGTAARFKAGLRRAFLGTPLPAGRFVAFISYRQLEPDRAWAVRLHKALERYQAPKGFKKRRLGRVFRDADELAASPDLPQALEAALDASEWLIVVCSPRAKASKWVNAEIKRFGDSGRGERVLALLVEGEPKDAFPDALLSLRRSAPAFGLIVEADPLAADARPQSGVSRKRILRGALLSLAAAMLGVSFDALRRRDETRALKRLAWLAAGSFTVIAVTAYLGIAAEISRSEADTSRLQALRRESLLLANVSRQQTAVGDPVTGALLALRALPRSSERPLVGEAVGALMEALSEQREGVSLAANASGFAMDSNRAAIIEMANPGDSYFWELSSGRRSPLPHDSPVGAAAFSPDGQRLATGDWRGQVKLWSREGALLQAFRPHADSLALLDFSADGTGLVSVSADGTMTRIPATGAPTVFAAGKALRSATFDRRTGLIIAGREDGLVLSWHSDGHCIKIAPPVAESEEPALALDVTGSHLLVRWRKSGIAVHDPRTGRHLAWVAAGKDVTATALSPSGETVAAGHEGGAVDIWSSSSGARLADLPGGAGKVTDIRFSPDGAALAASGENGIIQLWSTAAWTRLAILGAHGGSVPHLAFTHDGRTLVSASFDGTVRTWSVTSPGDAAELKGHTDAIYSARESDDRNFLATASRDRSVRVWDLRSGRSGVLARPMLGPAYDAAFMGDTAHLAIDAWDNQLELWSAGPPVHSETFAAQGDKLEGTLSRDQHFVLAGEGAGVQVIETATRAVIRQWPASVSPAASFSPTRPQLLLALGPEMSLLEMPGQHLVTVARLAAGASQVGYDPSGALAFARLVSGDIVVLDASTLKPVATLGGHDDTSQVLLLPACNTAVTTAHPGRVRVWDLETGKARLDFTTRDEAPTVAADIGCRRLAVTEVDLVRLSALADGTELAVLRGQSAKLRFSTLMSDGKTLLTADEAGVLRRWPLPPLDFAAAESALPRSLTADQELRFGLR